MFIRGKVNKKEVKVIEHIPLSVEEYEILTQYLEAKRRLDELYEKIKSIKEKKPENELVLTYNGVPVAKVLNVEVRRVNISKLPPAIKSKYLEVFQERRLVFLK